MKLLPYHRFEIDSPLSTQDALAAMRAQTEPEKWFRWRWPSAANDDRFEGEVRDDGFHVRRIIGYRNSFLPVIDATVQTGARGSLITVTMRPFWFVLVFVAIWTVGAVAILFSEAWPAGLIMVAFLYLMTMGGFWFEASKQERTLRTIFRAD